MSLFRLGQVPSGVAVGMPAWQVLEPIALVKNPSESVRVEEPRNLESPQSEAYRILEQAHLDAAEVLQTAASEAEAALEQARQEGFAAGRLEGANAGQLELEQLRAQANEVLESAKVQAALVRQAAEAEARAARAQAEAQAQAILRSAQEEATGITGQARAQQQQLLDESREALTDLAVVAAVRLVQGHLAIKPAAIVAMVAAGLGRLKNSDCQVRVSLHDLPLLEAQRSTLERELGAGVLQLQPDPGIRAGSYVVSSSQGQIDAQLEHQTGHLRAALKSAMGGDD